MFTPFRSLSLLLFSLMLCSSVWAQKASISGVVQNGQTGETLISAAIMYDDGKGAVTDYLGRYKMEVPYGTHTFKVSYVGYKSIEKTITVDKPVMTLNYDLSEELLDQVLLVADMVIDRKTPVAYTNLTPRQVQEELGGRDIPLLLNNVPGVYTTQQGGGDGDARINIRGFSQNNIAVMIDGIPVNDMENGWVYWANWFGLDNVTRMVQVQRGLTSSKLSIPAVGGSLNILTTGVRTEEELIFKQDVTQFGKTTTGITYHSGEIGNDWYVSGVLSARQGRNFVEQTDIQGYFGFAKVTKVLGDHQFSLTSFIAPQERGQVPFRNALYRYDTEFAESLGVNVDALQDPISNLGRNYNVGWGRLERDRFAGNVEEEILRTRTNFYRKPQINLNHTWEANDDLYISNALYTSIGRGGGTRLVGGTSNPPLTAEGQVDLQSIYDVNSSTGIFKQDFNSETVLAASMNDHNWYGLLSKADWDINDAFNLSGGMDLRYYEGTHYREVIDLLGGDYFLEFTDGPVKDTLTVGDRFDYNNTTYVDWQGVFGQLEFVEGAFSTFLNLSGSRVSFRKEDFFLNKDGTVNDSGRLTKWGGTLKTGGSYFLDESWKVYTNLGLLSRQRPANDVFLGFTPTFRSDTRNERIAAAELGIEFTSQKFSTLVNLYHTNWFGRAINRIRVPRPGDPEEEAFLDIPSVNARHMGVEVEATHKVDPKLTLNYSLSLGNWIWKKQADNVEITNETGDIVYATTSVDIEDVRVGDAPQSQFGITANYTPVKNAYVRASVNYFANFYSDFNVSDIVNTSSGDVTGVWKMPNYSLINFFAGYSFDWEKYKLGVNFAMFNVLNTLYISDARNNDGFITNPEPSRSNYAGSASVFVGAPRNFSASLILTIK